MNDKQAEVKLAEFTVREKRIALRESKVHMEEGFKKLKARMDERYESLMAAHQMALLDLEEAEFDLAQTKEKAEKNFD